MTEPLLSVREVWTTFKAPRGKGGRRQEIQAVAGVDLTVAEGETVGLVGESGSGKSTLARTIVGLERARSGTVTFAGTDVTTGWSRRLRRDVQMVFQDPRSSLNPRMTVRDIVAEGWRAHPGLVRPGGHDAEVAHLLEQVGVDPALAGRRPAELSGGQCQRVAIARALALRPRLLVCDEAVSALDVSVQAQILALLARLREELGLAMLFISHDLGVVRQLSDRVAVMYLGKIVETGPAEQLYSSPEHPYTQTLLASALELDPDATPPAFAAEPLETTPSRSEDRTDAAPSA
ncbi:dipeptide ABC transporter ATP-binding protein [Plantactinospora mayteni]|uniref:ABC transporter ATP-binding protein n=1 Tax=Plantactinospora mayteni TaxID=566021 RepID=A0ABQ4F1A5_9ACTN|nr:ATP-binding cassette domain-containing protein [Plantactinospora mayteni]GIH00690.1 ABC transporter ATP-binding protein [Plantactinospora mayteni]